MIHQIIKNKIILTIVDFSNNESASTKKSALFLFFQVTNHLLVYKNYKLFILKFS